MEVVLEYKSKNKLAEAAEILKTLQFDTKSGLQILVLADREQHSPIHVYILFCLILKLLW